MQDKVSLRIRSIFNMALPVMLGSFIQFIIMFTDTAFLGHVGILALNTAGNASLVYLTLFITVQGLSEGLQILFARRLGSQQNEAIRELFWTALPVFIVLALIVMVLVFAFNQFGIALVIEDQNLAQEMIGFLNIRSWGYVPGFIQLIIMAYYMGIARTKILTITMLVTGLFNILLDYVLIFGAWGFPELGIEGAAWASFIAEFAGCIVAIAYLRFDKENQEGLLIPHVPSWFSIKRMMKVGSPLMFQRFVSLCSWTIFFIFIEKMGSTSLAISQIIRTLYFLAFIPIMGFSTTTRTFVSYFMARGEFDNVKKSLVRLCIVSGITTAVFIHGLWFYPEFIVGIISPDVEVINGSKPILLMVTVSMILFSVTGVYFNAVSGIGDTKKAMWMEVISIVIYLIGAWYFAVHLSSSLMVVWGMEFVYFGLLGAFSLAYFKWYPWRDTTV